MDETPKGVRENQSANVNPAWPEKETLQMNTEYKTPEKTLAMRNLLAKVPALADKVTQAEIRVTALPGYERGGPTIEFPGKDYAFPNSLESILAPLQKEIDAFLDAKIQEAQELTAAKIATANEELVVKLSDKGAVPDLFPAPQFRKREAFDVFSQMKSAIHDGAAARWYAENGIDSGSVATESGVTLDF